MNINSVMSHLFYYLGIMVHVAGTLLLITLLNILPWMPGWGSIVLTFMVVLLTMLNVVVLYRWFHYKKKQTLNFTVCPIDSKV